MKKLIIIILLAILAVAVVVCAPMFGAKFIPLSKLTFANGTDMNADILRQIRIPRVILAFIAGSALAVSGMAFQALFRNPLAEPFTLGVSSGASLGMAVYIRLGFAISFLGIAAGPLVAFFGAITAMILVYGLTHMRKGFLISSMLLAGVAVNYFFTAIIMLIEYFGNASQSIRIINWMMGGLEVLGADNIYQIFPFVIIGASIIVLLSRELNLFAAGEDIAISRGVNIKRVKNTVFFATSLMVGGVAAVCGPVGFVGMMCPHICRLLVGSDHRYLAPASLLFGGMFLVICDTIARVVFAPAEIPVGIITSLIGGPFFIWLLTKNQINQAV